MPLFSGLGEIQVFYGVFLKNLSDLNNYEANDLYGNKIISLTAEIEGIQEYMNRLKVKERLILENHGIETKKYMRDSSLFNENVISRE